MNPLPKAKCPTCKKEGDWFAGLYGPFCSHRCKLEREEADDKTRQDNPPPPGHWREGQSRAGVSFVIRDSSFSRAFPEIRLFRPANFSCCFPMKILKPPRLRRG